MSQVEALDDALRSTVARGKVVAATRAGRLVLQVQLLNGEVVDRVECLQPYGHSALPAPGTDVLMLTVGGVRDDKSVIAIDSPAIRIRDLAPGEIGMGDGNTHFVCRASGAEISTPGAINARSDGAATVIAPSILLQALGATVEALVDARFLALFNAHVHVAPAGGGLTTPPTTTGALGAHTTTNVQAS